MESNQNFGDLLKPTSSSGSIPAPSGGGFGDLLAQPRAPRSSAPVEPLDESAIGSVADREGLSPAQRKVMAALLQQESGGGRNTATSVDGARGAGQIMPGTFRQYAKPGESIDNTEHNLAVMARIVKDLGTKFGDDPAKIATGYFSGEGNVGGQGTAWKADRADGNGKRVSSYVSDVLARLGNVIPSANAAPATPDLGKAPKWADVEAKPEFQALTPEVQAQTKAAYFDYWIAPNAGQQAGELRQRFLGGAAAPVGGKTGEPTAAELEQAGKAAFGIYPNPGINTAGKKRESVLEGNVPPAPDLPTTSKVPVRPEVRAEFNKAWDAATPEQRQTMAGRPDWMGMLARERAGIFERADQNATPTTKTLDTRAEGRAGRLAAAGEDPRFAETAGRMSAAAGVNPGAEIPFMQRGGVAQESTFDFDTKQLFDQQGGSNGLNNPLVRGLAKAGLGLGKAAAGYGEFLSDTMGLDEAGKTMREGGKFLRGKEEAIGESGTFLERNLEGAINSIAQQLPLLIGGAAVASQAIPLAGMALQTFGQEYSDGKAKGQSVQDATTRAALFAAFELVGEKFGLGETLKAFKAAAKGLPADQIAGFLWAALKKEVPGEVLTTSGQFAVDKFGGKGVALNPNATGADYLKQVADTIAQTIMQSGITAGGTTGVSRGVQFLNEAQMPEDQFARALVADINSREFTKEGINEQVVRSMNPDGTIYMPGGQPIPSRTVAAEDAGAPAINPPAVMGTNADRPEEPAPSNAITDDDVREFGQTRFDYLMDKQAGTDEVPGSLTPTEQDELSQLEAAGDDVAKLRRIYRFDQPGTQNETPNQDQATGPALNQDAGSATGQPGGPAAQQEPAGQAPGAQGSAEAGQRYEGLPAGAPVNETEVEREARLEREAIQNNTPVEAAPDDSNVPFEPVKPRTEKEAKERRNGTQADQAQQAEAQQPTPQRGTERQVNKFDPTGWTQSENKINAKTGEPNFPEGVNRYTKSDDRGTHIVITRNGEVSQSRTLSPKITLENSILDFDAPITGRIEINNLTGQLVFQADDGHVTKMSPRASQQYKDGVPVEKIAETEFSDAGGIRPDGSKTPHTTTAVLTNQKNEQAPAETAAASPTEGGLPAAGASSQPVEADGVKPKTEAEAKKAKAQADLEAALGDLGDILGKSTRMNIMPEDEQRLLPVLTRVMDAAFRLGYYKFKDAARFVLKTIREKLGKEAADQITLDHLQGSYIGMAGKYQAEGTASSKQEVIAVESLDELVDAVEETSTEPVAEPSDLHTAEGKFKVAQTLADEFIGGASFATIIEARKRIGELIGKKIEPGTELAKQADETIEVAVVLAAREMVKAGRAQGRSPQVIYDRLVSLYNAQPNLAVRSSTSVRDQAYSTPVPLAYVASELAGITDKSRVVEPTAGNGMLLIGANADRVTANELNSQRFQMLRAMGFRNAHRLNAATEVFAVSKSQDAVIANPPFGATKDDQGNTIVYEVSPSYGTREVDHAIAFKALEAMKDDGRAVLIVGGSNATSEDGRREDYRGKNKRAFYFNLYQQYNVVDHFTVDGSLYSKQGASYPVDVIVIEGRGKSSRDLPAADLPKMIGSYDELKEKLNGTRSVGTEGDVSTDETGSGEAAAGAGDGTPVVGSPGRSGAGTRGQGGGAGNDASVQGAERPATGVSEPSGAESGTAQPKPANADGTGNAGQAPVSGGGDGTQPGREGRAQSGSDGLGGASVVSGERVGSGLNDRRGEEQETENQVEYTPHSQASSVGTLVPRAMRDAIEASLQKLEDQVGNLDEYVAERLSMDPETVRSNFSAEQVDALALAIKNAEEGRGFIIGDQTGIGKGRVVAAMIRYALVNDKTPIFVTEKPNLYADMIRDLDDIGMTDDLALDTNKPRILITNSKDSIPYTLLRDVNGEVTENNLTLRAPKSGKELEDLMKGMMEAESLGEYKVIFTTYSQLQTHKGKVTQRMKFVQQFGAGNYMIFDESHNAGGAGETQARTKEQREKAKEGESLVTGRAAFVRGLVGRAYGTFFSSATYAKRPDVMDLYSSTNMKLAVDKLSQLAEAIKLGGVPMQQVVANMLTMDGQYIRRERTFAGVSYDTTETKVEKQTAENMAIAMRSILAFSRAKEAVIANIQKEMDKEGQMIREMGGEKSTIQGANFGSIMHNLIDQMLLSLKAQDSVRHAIERLKAGEKVVMTVSNTMGSFLKDYAEEMGLNVGDPVALSFADLYVRYLDKQRMVTIKDAAGNKTQRRLTDKELGPALVAQFEAVRQQIMDAGFGSAPISPIDFLHTELRRAGYKTDEITGRTITINYDGSAPKLTGRSATIKQRVNAVRGFNNGDIDVIILNQAGSTGLSLHASSKFKDQRKRHMIIVQAEKNIDTHMQMLGRVHRTGQVIAPAYSQMMADVPAEMRPAAVLLKKMASLNANTTASRKSSVTAEGVVDFMNDYGGQVVQEYLRDNPDVLEAIGGSKVMPLAEDSSEGTEDDIRKLTGYIPILPIKQQEEIYRDLIDRYNELIERENTLGTNKLEAKAVDLDAETISTQQITEDKGDPSVFASPANMERVDVKRTVKPFTQKEVLDMVDERLGGKTAEQVSSEQIADLNERAKAYAVERVAKMQQAPDADQVRIEAQKNLLNMIWNNTKAVLENYHIGQSISIKDKLGQIVYGVITDIHPAKRTANPAVGSDWKMQIALANGDAKTLSLTFSQISTKYQLAQERSIHWFNPETQQLELTSVLTVFDKGTHSRREKRWIVTGNILGGFAKFPGQIITYTRKDGTTGQGVLMSRQFDFEKEMSKQPVRMNSALMAVKFVEDFSGTVGTEDGVFKVTKHGSGFNFFVPSSKKDGGTYYLDRQLTSITGDFYKRGSIMVAKVYYADDAMKALEYIMSGRQEPIVALTHLDKAKQMLGEQKGKGNLQDIVAQPAVYKEDIPNENWLAGKVQDAEEGGRNKWGVPRRMGSVTGYFKRPLNLPTYLLSTLKGESGEQENVREDSLKYIRENWDEVKKEPVYVEVDPFGVAWVSEGNHRIMVARELGEASLPVEVRYFSGGQRKAGPWAPNELLGLDARRQGNNVFDFKRSPSIAFSVLPEQKRVAARQKLNTLEKKLDAGKITEAEYVLAARELTRQLNDQRDERVLAEIERGRRRGADWIVSQLRRGVADGMVPRYEADFAQWLLEQNPQLANDLGYSISGKEGGNARGEYSPFERIMYLFSANLDGGGTAVHEILHHTEAMMPREVQAAILREWQRQWDAAYKKATKAQQQAMRDMLAAAFGDKEAGKRVSQAFGTGVLSYDQHYQLFSPSEFWAVNATRILSGRYAAKGLWVSRAAQWLKEFVQRVKAMLGLRSDNAVIQGLKAVMAGDGSFQSGEMLRDMDFEQWLGEKEVKKEGDLPPVQDITRKVQRNLTQFFGNRDNLRTFSFYDRTLSTQFNKALKDEHYGKVFAFVNAMQNEVSLTSIRPAELAPGILRKVDDSGSAIKTLAMGNVRDKSLQGATNAMLAGTLDGKTVLDGKVWTEEELRNNFQLDDAGVALYQQGRAAIDASLEEVAAAEAYAMAQGYIPKQSRRQIIDNPKRANNVIFGALAKAKKLLQAALDNAREQEASDEKIASLEETIKAYEDTEEKVKAIFAKSRELKAAGYMPLMRFGQFTVTVQEVNPETGNLVRDDEGEAVVHYFGMFETQAEANAKYNEMQVKYAGNTGVKLSKGVKSNESYKLYSGISPETLALFAEEVGADKVMREYYKQALAERSALKRRLERKKIEGFSDDLPRILSNFITSNGRMAAQRYYLRDLNNAIKFIPKEKGDVMDEAIKLREFMMTPNDPAAPVSALMFAWFLGGSVASALVNLTQPLLMTGPYLSQFGPGTAAKAMANAFLIAMGRKQITDPDLRKALKRASQEGIVEAQEIFHLYSQGAQGVSIKLANTLSKLPVVGNKLKAGTEGVRARSEAFFTLWGMMFSVAESFNRKLTFLAAWNVAIANKDPNPYAFAVRAVNETQGIYNKANRPNLARSATGRVVLTFKQFSLMYVELVKRMATKGGPEGKRAALIMMAMLMLAAGEEGLPFAQDLEDLIDTIGQMMGYDTNVKRNKRRLAYEILGKTGGDLFLYGVSSVLPLDFSGRLGLGNLIPGTGLFKASAEGNKIREVTEVVGPAGSLLQQINDAYEAKTSGNTGKAIQSLAPKAVKDVAQGVDMATTGTAKDTKGRKNMDVTLADAVVKSVGFNPTKLAQASRARGPVMQDRALQKNVESDIVDMWARGIATKDEKLQQEAAKQLKEWNAKNPQTPVAINNEQVRQAARQYLIDQDARIIKSAPRELRGRAGLELAK